MPLNLNDFKKTTPTSTPTKTKTPLDLSTFKNEKKQESSLLGGYSKSVNDIAKNTSAYGFEGVSRAAGALTELTGRTVAAAAQGAGYLGSGIYKGVGNVVGLFSKKGEAKLDQVAENFKANQNQFAEKYKTAAQDINKTLTDAGENARDVLLKTDKEAYAEHQQKMQDRAKRVAEGGSDFQWKDMTEADFWIHDMYGGLLQNAPTMALSIYGGAQAKVGTGVLSYLSQAGASTAFSTGMNAATEAESAYADSIASGKSKEEALIEADRVFTRNATANGGTEAAQMLLLFAPQMKFASPWLKALVESGKLLGAGGLEAIQERGEDSIQSQKTLEDFDWGKFGSDITKKGLTRTDVVSFLMGMAFQGGGNIFVNEGDVKKAAEEKINQVAERLPDDGKGGTPEERVTRAIETTPSAVDEAVNAIDSEISQVTDQGREEAKVARLSDFAQQAIDSGRSPSEVVVALSGQIPTTRAREIVDNIEANQETERPKNTVPTAKELLDQTPTDLQGSIEQLDTNFREKTDALKQSIEQLQQEVKDAPKNSPVKIQKKQDLERTRAELRRAEKQFKAEIENGGVETRRQVERYVLENTDFSRSEQRALTDRIIDKIFNTGVNVPISTVINNEVRKFNPASAAKQSDIEAAASRVTNDPTQKKRLIDSALEVLQSKDFAPVVADMNIDQVMQELAKADGLFQVKNASRKPTGKAQFKNIKDDDLKAIATYIDAVRGNTDISPQLDTAVMRLAERYGINTNQSEKQIVLAFERLIGRNNLDERVDALLNNQQELNQKQKKETKRKETAAKIKKEKEANVVATGRNLPDEIKKQLEGLPFMKNVPVNMVKRITTPDGYDAFGRFYRGAVEFVENPDVTTIPHEAFHVASQMGLNNDERQAMYKMAREAYADPELTTDLAVEEKLAQDFAEWYITEENPANFSAKLIGYFKKIKDFLLDMVSTKNRKALKEIYRGILSEDINTRVKAKTTQNHGRFFQNKRLNQNDTLLAVHNLSAENLLKADEIGGLANPSVAVLDPDIKVLTGFGDITLLGSKDLVTSSKAKTFAADVYSPRFPSTDNTYNYTKAEAFKKANGIESWDFDLEKFSYDAHRSHALKELYLKKTGKLPKDFKRESYEDSMKVNELILQNDEDFNNFLVGVRREVGADNERIFFGFSPSGKRKYKELSAENASKYMNMQEQQGGESFFYGMASLRAILTPNISTTAKMRKSKDKLVSQEEMLKLKEQFEAEFTTLMDELSKYKEDRGFGSYSDTASNLADYFRGYRDAFTEQYGYHGVPKELLTKVNEFADKLRNMPTEYFETKFKRVVDIGEFSAAVVPHNLSKRARQVLEGYGLPIYEYNATEDSNENTGSSRNMAIRRAATAGESLFFQRKKHVDGLYDLNEDPQENSIYNELSAQLEQIMYEIETMFELSEAGYRLVIDDHNANRDSNIIAVESTFPKWIPERLRSKQLMDKVLKQIENNEAPKGSRQAELHQVIEDYILERLPSHLADEKVINDYMAEQYKVADQLRIDAINLMKRMALKVAERQATLKKGQVKNIIRTNTGQIRTDTREFSNKMKERARHFNRGYKKGYKQGASDKFREMLEKRIIKRDRNAKIEKVKSIYRRVRQATRTGSYLPVEYQNRLNDLFEDFDMTKMTEKTQKKLGDMALYFAEQEGEVPQHIAEKLKRLEKFAIGEMTDEQLEEFVTEVSRIFEQGVKLKELRDTRDEKRFEALVGRVTDGLKKPRKEKSGFNLATFDPARVADMLDGTNGKYDGSFFKEVIEPIRVKGDQADIESNALLADTFEQISAYGNSFTEEQMARITVEVYRRQEGLEDAVERTVDEMGERGYDMTAPITETEAAIADILSETFKEIRPEVAATYEAINNKAFPDLKNYFPVKYDKDVEKFDINDANEMWDFNVTKTSSGFTVSRKENVSRVLDTNIFHTLVTEVNKQVFYAKMQPELDRAVSVINAKPVQSLLTSNEQRYLATFIKDVATQGRRTSDNAVVEEARKVSSKIRTNINQAILFYKMSTVLIQPTAVFDGAANINKRFGTKAAWKVVPNLLRMAVRPSLVKQAQVRSAALKNRAGGQIELKEMRDAQQGTFSPSPWRKAYSIYQKYGAAGIKSFDLVTASAVWDRAYTEFKKDGLSDEMAILAADQLTSLSQSSANIVNRPQFLNSEGVKFAMPFQTFLTNAANNVRYDLVETEIKENGYVTGTVRSLNNLQFILYAVAMEAALRELYGELWGYEDDDDDTWYKKLWASTVGRVPLSNWFLDFDGNLKDKIALDHPAAKSANDIFNVISDFANSDDITNKEIYNAVKGLMTLFGVAGTQQIHQLVTAPDIADMGSIGEDLGLTYDQRTLQEKQSEKLQEVMAAGAVKESDIETIAADIYGKNYDEKGVEYRAGKNLEVMEEIAYRQKWGFEDGFLDVNLNKKSNNDVKAYFVANPVDLKEYYRPVEAFGTKHQLLSDQLYKELRYIERASQADKDRIAKLAVAETDEEKLDAIGGDKDFAKRAFASYKILSKELYESIR